MMVHEDYKEMLAPQALDALDTTDARAFEDHLSGCAECRAELGDWHDAAALLAHAATPTAPSDELRARILSAAKHRTEASSRVVPMPPRPTSSLWPALLKIAAAVAFVALIGGVLWLWRRDVTSRREIARLNRELAAQERVLARSRDALAHQRDLVALLSSPNAKKMELAGTAAAQKARGTFVYDQQTGSAMLTTDALPAAPSGMAYELWFIPKGHLPMAGKVFSVDASGRATVTDLMPPEAREKAVIAITLEPKHGSAQPTGAIYLSSPS
jgi:anti-sigma-K factor RskA